MDVGIPPCHCPTHKLQRPQSPRMAVLVVSKGLAMFVFLLLCLTAPALAQGENTLQVDQVSAKLWRVIDITRVYTPQTQAHVVLEAPDKERLSLAFHIESA